MLQGALACIQYCESALTQEQEALDVVVDQGIRREELPVGKQAVAPFLAAVDRAIYRHAFGRGVAIGLC